MLACALCVILTLVVGGVTRLTESGLSITEWKPVSGVLPPLDQAGWQSEFERYLQIPEARTVHRGITLEEFKSLFWWEWLHRVVARLAGLVIALPWVALLVRRRIPRGLGIRLALLPLLTGIQGALGWYMVRSGLSDRTDVSQYRLVAHLSLALVIYVVAIWTWFELRGSAAPRSRSALSVAALAALTIVSGGFVAGLDAGRIYNTFPLMGPGLVPPAWGQLQPLWRNLFENPATVQFNHRLLAMVTALFVAAQWWRHRGASAGSWHLVLGAALLQVSLGIATLLLRVPVGLAALHQLGAVLLLTAALRAAHQSSASAAPPPQSSRTTAETMAGG
jgi:cytochrome c oxidase assembly protein subunit 15